MEIYTQVPDKVTRDALRRPDVPGLPDDAKAWDGIGARLPVGDRV